MAREKSRSKRLSMSVCKPKPKPKPDEAEQTARLVKKYGYAPKRWQKDIIRWRQYTDLLSNRAPFQRLCKEILQNMEAKGRVRINFIFSTIAIEALQWGAEYFISSFLEESNMIANHAKRVTLQVKDMQLLTALKYELSILY